MNYLSVALNINIKYLIIYYWAFKLPSVFTVKKSEHFYDASVKLLISLLWISNGEICKGLERNEGFCYVVAKWPSGKVVLVLLFSAVRGLPVAHSLHITGD